uniref:Uncharacterized protein n=2 Tax=Tetraselmis sp. GSL018 TaxID=582737 RepID=A0A061R918_9CHLO
MLRARVPTNFAGKSVDRIPLRYSLARRRCGFSISAQQNSGGGFNGDSKREHDAKDALIKSLGEVSKQQGREPETRNFVLGSEGSIEKWRELDEKVNEYPGQRSFKCVGVAESGFRESMVQAVEDVVGSVHPEMVNTRSSSKGNYISVQIGPVIVKNPDQVIEIFSLMKQDERLKWVM